MFSMIDDSAKEERLNESTYDATGLWRAARPSVSIQSYDSRIVHSATLASQVLYY